MYDWDNDGYISEYDDMISNIMFEDDDDDDCKFNNVNSRCEKSENSLLRKILKGLAICIIIYIANFMREIYYNSNYDSIILWLKDLF